MHAEMRMIFYFYLNEKETENLQEKLVNNMNLEKALHKLFNLFIIYCRN